MKGSELAYKALPSQGLLRQLLDYDPETGVLTWRERPVSMFSDGKQAASHNAAIWNGKNAGKPAGSPIGGGYVEFGVGDHRMLAHRIAWKWMTGEDPNDIDHINGDTSDNSFANLRNVSHQDNGRNMKLSKASTSGCPGVYWDKRRSLWCARIHLNYRNKFLGQFASFDEAVAARRAAEVEFGFHENHGQR